jgi:hypothetical protein
MADNDLDSGQASGTAGSPASQSSSGEGGSSSSFDAGKLQSLIEGFGRRMDEIDARTKSLQGDKDRAVVKTKKEVEELKAKIAEYEKLKSKGLAPDDALEEMDFRSTVRQLQEQLGRLGSVSTQAAGNGASGADTTAKAVLEELKLDANSAEVISILGKGYNAEKQELELRRLAMRSTTQPQPSAAESAAIQGQPAQAGDRDLQSAYEKKRNEIAQTLRGDAKVKALSDLKVDFRGRGLNI